MENGICAGDNLRRGEAWRGIEVVMMVVWKRMRVNIMERKTPDEKATKDQGHIEFFAKWKQVLGRVAKLKRE
jgi:hypothetical protein